MAYCKVTLKPYGSQRDKHKIDTGLKLALSKLIGYSIIAVGIIIALQGLGIRLSALTVFAGVLGVGIGFGMQNITANIVSGVVILFERPIKEGDMVRLQNTIGQVKKINLRATVIRTIYNEGRILTEEMYNEMLDEYYREHGLYEDGVSIQETINELGLTGLLA